MHEIELWLSIASKSVEVLREELSYPFLSLVADIGGVLGLFIGFNFLMIWDGVLFCVVFNEDTQVNKYMTWFGNKSD